MALIEPGNTSETARHRQLYAIYEMAFTTADFSAAMSFLAGSILFFDERSETVAIWLFVIGSAFFTLKPGISLVREIHFLAIGDVGDVAKRLDA